ncbi:MAG: hydroxymethylbilane synthase [Dehalococcoidia bacterium]|nr:hydroxymethylbilane synthase [Dehalococcoidia bacterium]
MRKDIVIGSRSSRLAVLQAKELIGQLRNAMPELELSLVKIKTQGDKDRKSPIIQIGGRGVFVKELEDALLGGEIDIAVHSLKDMPSQLAPGLQLAAVPVRRDPRDALVSGSGRTLAQLPPGARIGTGSQRRALELQAFRPDLKTCPLRGNVDTRVNKVRSGELDGIIVAAAALERIGWRDKATEYLPIEIFLPAACQGALGVEVRAGDGAAATVALVNDEASWQTTAAERAFLRTLGGGCQSAIAAMARVEDDDTLHIEGMVAGTLSRKIIRAKLSGLSQMPEQLGERLAQKMLDMGAGKLIEEALLSTNQ